MTMPLLKFSDHTKKDRMQQPKYSDQNNKHEDVGLNNT